MNKLTTTNGLKLFIERRMPAKDTNCHAWVLIWYMHSGCVGHVSMFIGDISVVSPYVSWWPETTDNKVIVKKYPAKIERFIDGSFKTTSYELDCNSEHRAPDVIYGLTNLNKKLMMKSWVDICCEKPSPSFRTVGKNCADIVRRVLKSGLENSPLRHRIFGFADGDYYICTPKRVAVICNSLRNHEMAVKIPIRAKPGLTPVQSLFRLR